MHLQSLYSNTLKAGITTLAALLLVIYHLRALVTMGSHNLEDHLAPWPTPSAVRMHKSSSVRMICGLTIRSNIILLYGLCVLSMLTLLVKSITISKPVLMKLKVDKAFKMIKEQYAGNEVCKKWSPKEFIR